MRGFSRAGDEIKMSVFLPGYACSFWVREKTDIRFAFGARKNVERWCTKYLSGTFELEIKITTYFFSALLIDPYRQTEKLFSYVSEFFVACTIFCRARQTAVLPRKSVIQTYKKNACIYIPIHTSKLSPFSSHRTIFIFFIFSLRRAYIRCIFSRRW